jgi:hypothetical protein
MVKVRFSLDSHWPSAEKNLRIVRNPIDNARSRNKQSLTAFDGFTNRSLIFELGFPPLSADAAADTGVVFRSQRDQPERNIGQHGLYLQTLFAKRPT